MKIQNEELLEKHVAKNVTYIPHHANGDVRHEDCERGIITSWNENYVFVRYGNGETSAATDPKNLVWGHL